MTDEEFKTAEQAAWKPIETAPRDGAYVLVYPPTWNDMTCSIAQFDDARYAKNPRPFWRRIDDNNSTTRSRDNPPTHWRPMPAPPILLEESKT